MPDEKKTVQSRAWWPWIVLFLIILFVAAIRVRVADAPLERDEGEYAYAGQLILKGVPPYKMAYNMKLPGSYVVYAGMMAIFGETVRGIHLGMAFLNAVTIVLIFLLGRKLFDTLGGLVTAASFALLSTSHVFLALAAHANHFVVLFLIAGLLVLLKAQDTKRISLFFWSGILLGLAFLMKQQGVFFLFFGAVSVFLHAWQNRPIVWKDLFGRILVLALGCVVPFLLTCLILWRVGVFEKFWFWTFTYGRQYVSVVSISDIPNTLGVTFPYIFQATWAFWILALAGINLLLVLRSARSKAIWLISLFVASVLALSVGFLYRSHYFILMLPSVCLLVGGFFSFLPRILPQKALYQGINILLFFGVFGYSVYLHREAFFLLSPTALTAQLYGKNPFNEAEQVAKYIRDNSKPGERVAVLGSEPEIYFLSGRRSATGYIYTYGLMEPQPFALQMQKEMMQEIETAKPEYIVVVKMNYSWLIRSDSHMDILDWVATYVPAHYNQVGLIDYRPGKVDVTWGADAVKKNPQGEEFIVVFRRNDL